MVGEKKEEDIVGRLEALRKKVPPPTAEKGAPAPSKPAPKKEAPEARRKTARIVGIFVIIIILGGVFFVGYSMFIKTEGPAPTMPPADDTAAREQARLAELAKAKSAKLGEIKEAFSGLPQEYRTKEAELQQSVDGSETKEAVDAVDYETPATDAWRTYRKAEVDEFGEVTGEIIAQVDDALVKGADEIKTFIDSRSFGDLKIMDIRQVSSEFIPIRLPRTRITGGFAEVGDRVNIHYRWIDGNNTARIKYLAKDGRVVSIMRAAGTIALSESEEQSQTGGGSEGTGEVDSITIGDYSITIDEGPYGASVGVKTLEKSSSYTVNLAEVQKAAAASKISEEELMDNLRKYGVRLTEIERETNIADYDVEFLMLVEVSEEEASEVVLRLLDDDEKANMFITISKEPTWTS